MRALETEIRKCRGEINALRSFGNSEPQISELRRRIRAFQAKYDQISEVTGIDKETNRLTVRSQSATGGVSGGASKTPITPITETVINSVKKVNIDGFTESQNAYIQDQHKELLRYARDNNGSNEVAFVYRRGLTDRTIFKGSDDVIDFGNGLDGKGDGLFIMHNHPRNSSFSNIDLKFIVSENDVNALTIVKNNGDIEVLSKSNGYNAEMSRIYLIRAYKKYVFDETNDGQINRAIRYFLDHNGGNFKWIKQQN